MRTLFKTLAGVLLALLLLTALALLMAVDGAPRVDRRDDVSTTDIDRAVALLRQHDPRLAAPGQLQQLALLPRDLDLLAHHAARRWLAADARARLQPGRLLLDLSIAAPLGRWLNIELGLRETRGLPAVDSLRVGQLPLPSALVLPAARAFAAREGVRVDALLAVEMIERVGFGAERMTVAYRMGLDTVGRLRAAIASPLDQQRLQAYAQRLAEVTRGVARAEAPVVELLRPLLALAAERATAGGDAVAENRAALLTLAFFANQRPLGQLVPAAYTWPAPSPLIVTLQQRHDTAQHFLVSAVIAAEADTPLADAVGLWKELADAGRGGSGFSFHDLTADRAGTRFGELASRRATVLYQRLAASRAEAELMPYAADLPEALTEAQFQQRFGGIDGAAFKRLRADIEARVDALPLFR